MYIFEDGVRSQMTEAELAEEQARVASRITREANEKANNPLRFQHNGRYFLITAETIAKAALLEARRGNGKFKSGQKFRDEDGVAYTFTDGDDFDTWLTTAMTIYDTAMGWT